jgi:membrane-bound lytic murein transglycosylase B
MLAQYRSTLAGIEQQSGVPREILLAVWGMESDFGRDYGSFNLFAALATLGYQGPRADFAKPEFQAALKILQEQHYAASDMKSSWAGAFGQTQFTPTTFLKYAADGDHDGAINLWTSPADALASAANLLAGQGWKANEAWGYRRISPMKTPTSTRPGPSTNGVAAVCARSAVAPSRPTRARPRSTCRRAQMVPPSCCCPISASS